MGAAYDYMCKSEGLENTLNNRNRKIREQKKLIIELYEAYIDLYTDNEQFNPKDKNQNPSYIKAIKTLNKLNNKKKK